MIIEMWKNYINLKKDDELTTYNIIHLCVIIIFIRL